MTKEELEHCIGLAHDFARQWNGDDGPVITQFAWVVRRFLADKQAGRRPICWPVPPSRGVSTWETGRPWWGAA